jgi:hypothetical protein
MQTLDREALTRGLRLEELGRHAVDHLHAAVFESARPIDGQAVHDHHRCGRIAADHVFAGLQQVLAAFADQEVRAGLSRGRGGLRRAGIAMAVHGADDRFGLVGIAARTSRTSTARFASTTNVSGQTRSNSSCFGTARAPVRRGTR